MHTFLRTVGIPGVSNFGTVDGDAGIYRSACPEAPLGYGALKLQGVKTVLCLQQEDPDEPSGLKLLWYPLFAPMPVPLEQYVTILAGIENAPKPLLIHCLQGHDRTGVVCAAYRLTHGWSLTDAIEEMKAYGFLEIWIPLMDSLKAFAKSIGVKT